MNLLDIIIVVTMVYFVLRGMWRGFFQETSSLVGIILGIWLANSYQPQMSEFLKTYLPPTQFLPLISFAAIFALVLVICNLLGAILKHLIKKALLGWLDRILGAGIAIIKGVILTYLVIVLLTFFLADQTPLIAKSRLTPLIIKSYQSMIQLISPDHYQRWKKKIVGGKGKRIKTILENAKDMGIKYE